MQIIADEHSNKVYTTKDINLLLQKLNEALLNKGYITSKVLLKPQKLSTGVLKLSLIVGRIEEVKFNNKGYYGNFLSFKKGNILNIRELEQTIDNLNSVLNQKATVKLEPGSKVGDTVVIFNIENNARFEIDTSVDNFGNKDTGKTQGNLSLTIAKPLNINDSLYYSVTKSFPFINIYANSGKNNISEENINYEPANIKADNIVNIKNTKDLNIIDAKIEGDKIIAKIEQNLNIKSLQNIHNYTGDNKLAGFDIGLLKENIKIVEVD